MVLFAGGNLDSDADTTVGPVGQVERPAVELNDLPGHGEAEAGALADPQQSHQHCDEAEDQ
jgi:hypothetical protein